MKSITNYELDQRVTYNGDVCVITAIDNSTQTIELYNTWTGMLLDVKITEL